MNLVSLAMQFLTPALVGKIASALGLNQGLVGKAITAAIPSILAGIAGKASKPDGARSLLDILGKQDAGLLGSLGGMIGGAGQDKLTKDGNDILGSLLGGSGLGALTGAIGKFAGIGDAPTKSLVGMLAPVVLGQLGQQQREQKLDAGGLASLLAGQKDNITSAMPAGFSKLLEGSGLLDSISGQLKSAAGAAAGAAGAAASTAGRAAASAGQAAAAARDAVKPAPTSSWLPWSLAALAALLLGWYFLTPGQRPASVSAPLPKMLVDGVDVGGQTGALLETLKSTLGSVKDVASAQSALPKLQEAATGLDKVSALAGKLAPDQRKALAGTAASALPGLRTIVNTVLGMTGVSPVLKPVIDAIIGKIEAMAKA